MVRVDLSREESVCSSDIAEQIADEYRLRLPLSEITWTKKRWKTDQSLEPGTFVLSATAASRYLLKPIKKTQDLFTIVNPDYVKESETQVLTTLDRAITKISRRLNLVRLMRPDNYLEELDRFLTRNGKYNPTFVYKRPKKEKIDRYEEELRHYEEQYFGGDSPLESRFATLLHDKIGELTARCALLRAHAAQDYDAIAQTNRDYFAPYDEERLSHARDLIATKSPDNREIL